MINELNLKFKTKKLNICIIGLGYVGLPLAAAFSKYFKVVGFDISKIRINQLKNNIDVNQVEDKKKYFNKKLFFTSNKEDIKSCDIFIITVPTPINSKNLPNLTPLNTAIDELVKINLKNKFIVIESTIFPTLSNKYVKQIERKTGLKSNEDFYFGFSPERINPGDTINKLRNIDKIVSCENKSGLFFLKKIYKKIIKNVHSSNNLAEAEMAKIIENTQRDINISFINEISIICNKLNLNLNNVLSLASTKWNFLNFTPGLVGGHCISVDPYYLTFILKKINYRPKVILSGRNLNENYFKDVFKFVTNKIAKQSKNILIAGVSYKEDCNDIRNSKSIDLGLLFKKKRFNVHFYDPNIKLKNIKNIPLVKSIKNNYYDIVIICVRHKLFFDNTGKNIFRKKINKESLIYDLKRGTFCY